MQKFYEPFLKKRTRHFFIQCAVLLTLTVQGVTSSVSYAAHPIANTIQGVVVNGRVTDQTGSPLPGVNVLEKGTNNGTVSDSDGNYTISTRSTQSVLIFSFVGTVTQQVVVGNQSNINIQLQEDAQSLSEVVVVGYGTQERKDVTGSVGTVKSEEFNRGIINSPEQLLQGKVAGVSITSASGEPGSNQSINVRGPGGIRTGSTPLFVVDGLALDNSSTGGATNPLNFLNPQDIESIDVLKDASATAIYGTRGANGVILITTKKGKAGKSSISYSVDYGISTLARELPVFDADEYRAKVVEVGGILDDQGGSTNWQKEITRTAHTQNHNVNLSGGTDKLVYYASLGLQDQEGILHNSSLKRYSGRINLTQKALQNDKLKIDLNLSATQTINDRPSAENVIGTAISANPTYPVYGADGKPFLFPSGTDNPLITYALNKDITTTNRIIGNISPSLEIIKGLVYKLNFGIDNANSVRDEQSLPSLVPLKDGNLKSTFGQNTNSLIENYLTYDFKLNDDNNFSVLAGHSFQKFFIQKRTFSINKFPISDVEPRNNPSLGTDLTLVNNKPTGETTRNELQSFFGRMNYSFRDKYLLTATVRADGSTKFGANNKYGVFPSFSLGWRISEEAFMQSTPLSNLKLRAGWGQTGNQEIPNKITQELFTATLSSGTTGASYPLGGAYTSLLAYSRFANPNIQWEVSTQTNIGIDFGLLNGALSGSIDAFNKVSNNILLSVPSVDPQPEFYYWTNVDDMTISNSGLEISLNYEYRATNGLTLGIGGNTTFIRNKVEDSPYSVITSGTATGSGLTSATVNGYINGEPIGTFFLREFGGINENGLNIFIDQDKNGFISDYDRITAGTALPTTMYNFFARVGFKGFDLSANFNGVAGNKIFDNTALVSFYKGRLSKGLNTTAEAVEYASESINNKADLSTRYLKDGAYLRLNNLTLGYNFNPSSLGVGEWVTALRVYATGQNLFVTTKYDGYDPEVNTDKAEKGVNSYGIDYLSYPKARSFVFGLNVTF
ncbi:SusC/RagA family TonB-linked outer membrane protein [Chryseosolibacter indicus]|uniref:TonB-dependent receptor n=1 Tax=Chryseosolibacter indicus TaxID=2782351 RepID=A0ABS5VPZ9_9BACT|nr:TonB-dependent receptor [Chryseosolibacter indicus]MBT1703488.1 TonB-dependent receptor [Chryseosolibacter indicus]